MGERGLQIKSDYNGAKWENADFPVLCENCLGSSGFVRMIKDTYGGECKMCTRPFTVFKWRPKGEAYKKTEVCSTCSKLKNICQTCILDLEYGLPSQLRDAVLSEFEGTIDQSNQSDVNKEYQMQQQIVALSNGVDMWASRDNPNERLLKMARTVIHDREQHRIKLPPAATNGNTTSSTSQMISENAKRSHNDAFPSESSSSSSTFVLPPGINSLDELQKYMTNSSVANLSGSAISTTVSTSVAPSTDTVKDATVTVKPKPPKPCGPPPPSAFKHKQIEIVKHATAATTNV